jgi:hypothetical protein
VLQNEKNRLFIKKNYRQILGTMATPTWKVLTGNYKVEIRIRRITFEAEKGQQYASSNNNWQECVLLNIVKALYKIRGQA